MCINPLAGAWLWCIKYTSFPTHVEPLGPTLVLLLEILGLPRCKEVYRSRIGVERAGALY